MPGLKLTALRQVKILGTARPGESICIRAEVKGRLGNLIQAAATATIGESTLLQAEVTLSGGLVS